MHALLTSSYFSDSRNYGTMIKSPVEPVNQGGSRQEVIYVSVLDPVFQLK